jgi:hypothetical protein
MLRLVFTDNDDDVAHARVARQIFKIIRHLGRRKTGVATGVEA